MSLVLVRTDGHVEPSRVAAIGALLNNQVVPAIRRAIGGTLILPDYVTIRRDSTGTSSPDGRVPGTVDAVTGEIISIDPPIVSASESDDVLRFVLTHELGHYHELTTRKGQNIRIRPVRSTELWSEYFAQRVLWECGGMPVGTFHTGGAEATPDTGPSKGMGYLLSWLRAHHDASPDWLDAYEADKHEFLAIFVPAMDPDGRLDTLYRKFPEWDDADVTWVGIVWAVVAKAKIGQNSSRRSRRR